MTEPNSDRLALAFLERFWSDRDAGRSFGLLQYLDRFPGQEEVIAREYLSAVEEASGEKEGRAAPSEEGRIGPYRLIEELGRGGEFREAINLDLDDAAAPGAHFMLAAALHQRGDSAEAAAVQENLIRLMKGADLADLKLVEMQDALDVYRDAIGTAESKPSQAESRK